jgi:hypothetical protein
MGMKSGGLLGRIDTLVIRCSILVKVGDAPVSGVSTVRTVAGCCRLLLRSAAMFPAHAVLLPGPCKRNYGHGGKQSAYKTMILPH